MNQLAGAPKGVAASDAISQASAHYRPSVDPSPFIRSQDDGAARLDLLVENLRCAGCMSKVERTMLALPGVEAARVNMSTHRLALRFDPAEADPIRALEALDEAGFPATPYNPETLKTGTAAHERYLLTCLAVAGFAAANVMLLSVAVWSGVDMGDGTRTLFHWISALIAIPTVIFSGRPFFRSAWDAIKARHLNMDVPISLAVLLALGMSIQQTAVLGEHAYFDAAVTLLFFLLIGRYLDSRARGQARAGAERLIGLQTVTAEVVNRDGTVTARAAQDLVSGDVLRVAAGDRVAADGIVRHGVSEGDVSLITGESIPQRFADGAKIYAGTLNLSAPLEIEITAAGDDTFLSDVVRLMEAAEQGRAMYVRIADRVASIYAPAVHLLALGTFLGWLVVLGAGWQVSLMQAIAVLIVTCPCALALAVPVVQVVASGRLFASGVLAKSADGLERLAAVDTVVFDKTGTLTLGRPTLEDLSAIDAKTLSLAGALAAKSRHPLSRALADAVADKAQGLSDVKEEPGAGLKGMIGGVEVRLGSAAWCVVADDDQDAAAGPGSRVWFRLGDNAPIAFHFTDQLRNDAAETIQALIDQGLAIELLSGDHDAAVRAAAEQAGISHWAAQQSPMDKVARLEDLRANGHKVLMVGDGLNDAPALSAGHASMSPATAADISQTAADFVFQGQSLKSVDVAIRTARRAERLVRQNFGLAFAYNAIAVPLAVCGLVTPLIAAIAMSASSLVVTGNALRLRARARMGGT